MPSHILGNPVFADHLVCKIIYRKSTPSNFMGSDRMK